MGRSHREKWYYILRTSHADNLRQVIEVLVSCVQREVVLQHKSGEPHIVRWNGRTLFAELAENGRVVVSRLVVGEHDADAVLQQKPPEYALVFGLAPAVCEARPKFADGTGAFAQSLVDRDWDAADGVLHAPIIGSAGRYRRHRESGGSASKALMG